jgi:hypothetical protein
MEQNAYQGIQHWRLNRIFKLAGILCQPHPEPVVRQCKSATTGTASVLRKTSRRRGHGRSLSRSDAQTSAQELALAKALKPRRNLL